MRPATFQNTIVLYDLYAQDIWLLVITLANLVFIRFWIGIIWDIYYFQKKCQKPIQPVLIRPRPTKHIAMSRFSLVELALVGVVFSNQFTIQYYVVMYICNLLLIHLLSINSLKQHSYWLIFEWPSYDIQT